MKAFPKKTMALVCACTLAAGLVILPGCSSANSGNLIAEPATLELPDSDDQEAWDELEASSMVEQSTVDSIEAFSHSTSSKVLSRDLGNNRLYSPFSLYVALAMCAEGASGETKAQLDAVMREADSDLDDATVRANRAALIRAMMSHQNLKLTISDSLWVQRDFNLAKDYLDALTQDYMAEPYAVDFTSPDAAKEIASWIKDKTEGTIEPELEIPSDVVLALVNALYFKDSWTDPFPKENTETKTFHATESDVDADFMRRTTHASYVDADKYEATSLVFGSGATMDIVLPKEGVSVESLLSDPAAMGSVSESGKAETVQVNLTMPKFSVDYDVPELVDAMQNLGITFAFDSSKADFSKMSSDAPLYVSDIKQGTHIAVDEEGAEASAYTIVTMKAGSAMPPKQVQMVVDRPFVYTLRSVEGVPLFVGVVENPAA